MKEWITLANTIKEMAEDENVNGFVITGSMRPATALSADGPSNLYQAVCLAMSKEAIGQGVLAVFSDHIYPARTLAKVSTYSVNAISSGETGAVSIMRNDTPYFYETTTKKHTLNS